MVERLLVGRVGLLQVVHHEVAVTKTAPDVAVGGVYLENGAQILYSLGKRVLGAQDACNALHGWHRPLVVLECELIALHGTLEVLHLF